MSGLACGFLVRDGQFVVGCHYCKHTNYNFLILFIEKSFENCLQNHIEDRLEKSDVRTQMFPPANE